MQLEPHWTWPEAQPVGEPVQVKPTSQQPPPSHLVPKGQLPPEPSWQQELVTSMQPLSQSVLPKPQSPDWRMARRSPAPNVPKLRWASTRPSLG